MQHRIKLISEYKSPLGASNSNNYNTSLMIIDITGWLIPILTIEVCF